MNTFNITGLGYNPLNEYSKLLNENFSKANPIENNKNSLSDFEKILNAKMSDDNNIHKKTLTGNVSIDYDPSNIEKSNSLTVKNSASFGKSLANSFNSLNQQQVNSENLTMKYAAGEDVSIHDVMIASEKASLSMNMALQLRNRLLNAYNEIYQLKF